MKIEMVNHASVLIEAAGVKMITDPWLEGTAFDQGWALLSETKLSYEDFSSITHIWFSHEHPDHFSPLSLKKIPENYRREITVLFHKTEDKKVVKYCEKLGFKSVVELKSEGWTTVAPDFSVMNQPFGVDDSWLCVKSGGQTVLNINDCEVNRPKEAEKIRSLVGEVDVLLTQFSYAGWAGNKDEIHIRQKRAKDKLEKVFMQIEVFRPKFVIPFASYVWFCHEENFYMNDAVNKIGDVYDQLRDKTAAVPIILYPGESWIVGSAYDSTKSLDQYYVDIEAAQQKTNLIKASTVTPDVLQASSVKFIDKLRKSNNSQLLKLLFKPMTIHLSDLGQSFSLSIDGGFVESSKPYEQCDIALSSEALNYCFNNLWGWSTLRINGRLQVPRGAGNQFGRFVRLGHVAALNNAGLYLGYNLPFISFATRYALRAVREKLA